MKKIIYLFAIMLFTLVSCNNEEVIFEESNKINYTIEKEYLKFNSINDYVALHKKLYALSPEELIQWRNKLPFKTLESFYQANNIERYIYEQVSDNEIQEKFNTSRINPVLASMFSEDGILIINDTLMKIKGDELITVIGLNDQQINEIENINEYSKGIEKRKHTVLIEHKSFNKKESGMMKANIDDRSSIYYTSEKTRQYVNFDSFVQGGYVHFEMTGRHQRKSWFGWTFLPTNHPIYTGTVNVSGDPFNNYFNYSNQLNNSELIGVNVFVGNEGFFSKFDVTYTFQKTTSEAYGSNWHGSPTDTKGSFFRSYYRQNY